MIAIFGAPKYILKCEATFCEPDEHWWAILDSNGDVMCRVIMNADQVRQCIEKQGYSIISAADYFKLTA